jgi:hypothetical protein
MDELELKKREILTPLLFEAGAALLDCQCFEYGISFLLFHLSRLGVQNLDPTDMDEIMNNKKKKTLGQLIGLLKNHIDVREDIQETFQIAIDARNQIIHRILIDNIGRVVDENERKSLIKEIDKLRSIVRKADKLIRPLIEKLSEIIDGFDSESAKDEALKKLFETNSNVNIN